MPSVEPANIAAAWLVLDHGSDVAIFASIAGIFLGIPLVAGVIGAAIMSRLGRRWQDGMLFAALLALLVVVIVLFGT